jgi:hypothetical protein
MAKGARHQLDVGPRRGREVHVAPGNRVQRSGNALPEDEYYNQRGSAWITKAVTTCTALVERLTPAGSPTAGRTHEAFAHGYGADNPIVLNRVLGVVWALRDAIQAGHVRTIEELIHADVFNDFLGMAVKLQHRATTRRRP